MEVARKLCDLKFPISQNEVEKILWVGGSRGMESARNWRCHLNEEFKGHRDCRLDHHDID